MEDAIQYMIDMLYAAVPRVWAGTLAYYAEHMNPGQLVLLQSRVMPAGLDVIGQWAVDWPDVNPWDLYNEPIALGGEPVFRSLEFTLSEGVTEVEQLVEKAKELEYHLVWAMFL